MNENQIRETLKTSLLLSFRTGNVFVDTLITGTIIYLTTFVLGVISKLPKKAMKLIGYFTHTMRRRLKCCRYAEIIIKGRSSQESQIIYSEVLLAVLHKIKQLEPVKSEIRHLTEVIISNDEHYKEHELNLIVNQKEPFTLAEDIKCQVFISKIQANHSFFIKFPVEWIEGKPAMEAREGIELKIYSKKYNIMELKAFVEKCRDDYRAYKKAENEKSLHLYVYKPTGTSSDNTRILKSRFNDSFPDVNAFEEFSFLSNRTFNNTFSENIEDIKKYVDFFTESKGWYKQHGIPHTLGFLFCGRRGCGKTCTIKALANYTKRHIINVPIKEIKTRRVMRQIFYNNHINHKYIPLHERLYVLHDLDQPSHVEDDNHDNDSKLNGEEHKLSTIQLMELLDGIVEMNGRMLVINTNYPRQLNKDLIRPGRIDVTFYFEESSSNCTAQMFQAYFDKPVPDEYKLALPDKKWTSSELNEILLSNANNSKAALKAIIAKGTDETQ